MRRALSFLLVIAVMIFCTSFYSHKQEEKKTALATIAHTATATPTPEADTPSPSPSVTPFVPDEEEVIMLAKLIYAEAGGVPSDMEKAAVVWCVLNRVDDKSGLWPDTVCEVVTQEYQFAYYPECTLTDEFVNIADDVLTRWEREKAGAVNIGRVLPAGYCFFTGDGWHNNFTTEWNAGATWDWSAENPYSD